MLHPHADACELKLPLRRVAMHRIWREGWQTDRDVLGTVCFRGAVSRPLTGLDPARWRAHPRNAQGVMTAVDAADKFFDPLRLRAGGLDDRWSFNETWHRKAILSA